jgi:hypothetical protein
MITNEDLYVYSGSKTRTENKCLADKITLPYSKTKTPVIWMEDHSRKVSS